MAILIRCLECGGLFDPRVEHECGVEAAPVPPRRERKVRRRLGPEACSGCGRPLRAMTGVERTRRWREKRRGA